MAGKRVSESPANDPSSQAPAPLFTQREAAGRPQAPARRTRVDALANGTTAKIAACDKLQPEVASKVELRHLRELVSPRLPVAYRDAARDEQLSRLSSAPPTTGPLASYPSRRQFSHLAYS